MRSRQTLSVVSACLALQVLLHASPVHAALQSTGILDLATQHFQTSLAKWKPIFTQAALTLFWLLATAACVWELGSIALRGASMEAGIAFLVRFAFIEGLWLYVILNAVQIETAIIDSFRKLGSTASGLRQELMPSEILDLGFALLWKTTKFVALTGWSSPIVALIALVVTLIIVLIFGLTAANMVLLVISQWFLLYGGIFFLGFGGAPWESDKAKNYLYLGLSIGAQFLGMAAVIGIGQSFIEAQYAQLSDDTALGELVVILLVGGLMFLLANDIPKLFARFVPGSATVQGLGMAGFLGGMASAAAALAASTAMAKGAMEAMGGIAKAASAAKDAAKSQKQPQPPPRSQTGIGSSGGSIGPAGGGSNGAGARTQGPLGTMLASTGIGPSQPQNGASRTPAATRAGTSTVAAKSTTTPQKAQPNQTAHEGNGSAGSRRSADKSPSSASRSSADSSQETATPLRARTHANAASAQSLLTDAHTPSPRTTAETENGERVGVAEAAISAGRRGDCAPHSDEATAEADVQCDAESSSPESSAAHADTSSSSNDATSASVAGREDASSMAPAHAAPTGVDGEEGPSSTRTSTPTSSSAATSTSSDLPSAPATASTGTSSKARTATAEQSSAPAATTTSARTGTQSTPPSAATTGANAAGSTQSSAAPKARTAEAASAAPGAGEGSSEPSKPASATPSSPDSEASSAPGGQRGSTTIGGGSTVLAAAKILGEHTLGHYRARGEQFKDAIMARVDNTTGGQIAQAIRTKYGIEKASKTPTPVRSATTISEAPGSMSESEAAPTPPPPRRRKHPAHWSSGDDPMTDDQLEFLERKLGNSFDLNMTKAEAAILIDELIHEE